MQAGGRGAGFRARGMERVGKEEEVGGREGTRIQKREEEGGGLVEREEKRLR